MDVTAVVIDRPERRNAVDLETLERLATELEAARGVVVLSGTGGHFCAGADLGGVENEVFADALWRVLDRLRSPELVTIAAIEGVALGAGTQLAVCCDLRVATADARFGIPAARLGLAVDHETVRRLVAFVGEGTARAMLLAAAELPGADAHRLGLVQRVGAVADARAWADEIAVLAPLTIAAHKVALEAVAGRAADDEAVVDAWRRAWASADLQEGLAAFRERRSPTFGGI